MEEARRGLEEALKIRELAQTTRTLRAGLGDDTEESGNS